ncbi:metal ABC transporter solute-binding protein, Zn/Mn family [Neobacillus niacini]|uniref:metal ABC transporter solute-binding protein, Zn/Mn family n=1 Tax=Neobacillus niacini TaxID=86668 RepID=UPI00285432A1|nr:zinc ABC transporter substrate-binding protein [Neobacillus niacini]MDR6997743.1 zinc/manganese transport system substrate-binding protein [Neobacillus niacini]
MENKIMRKKWYSLLAVGCSASLILLSGCADSSKTTTSAPAGSDSKIKIVAAENFYGEVAKAVGGNRVEVTSILDNPNVDPHDYEPTAETSKLVNDAKVIMFNGAGYDEWMDKVIKASSSSNSKSVIKVAEDLMGKKEGDNEHVWYDPTTMPKLAIKIADDLSKLDPTHKEDFNQRAQSYIKSLEPLKEKVQELKQQSATNIDVSEPVFDYMAKALNLKVNNSKFARAIDEGTDPAPSDIAALQNDLNGKKVKLLVHNTQNSTPVVDNIVKLANSNSIPIVKVTETKPKGKNYLQWMVDQLDDVAKAIESK